MDRGTVLADIEYIRDIVKRTHARVDSHSFHSVNRGLIVPGLMGERRVARLRAEDGGE